MPRCARQNAGVPIAGHGADGIGHQIRPGCTPIGGHLDPVAGDGRIAIVDRCGPLQIDDRGSESGDHKIRRSIGRSGAWRGEIADDNFGPEIVGNVADQIPKRPCPDVVIEELNEIVVADVFRQQKIHPVARYCHRRNGNPPDIVGRINRVDPKCTCRRHEGAIQDLVKANFECGAIHQRPHSPGRAIVHIEAVRIRADVPFVCRVQRHAGRNREDNRSHQIFCRQQVEAIGRASIEAGPVRCTRIGQPQIGDGEAVDRFRKPDRHLKVPVTAPAPCMSN